MIERNTVTAVIILMALFIGYQFYYDWRFGDYIQAQQTAEEAAAGKELPPVDEDPADIAPTAAATPDLATPSAPVDTASTPDAVAPLADTREKTITLDTGVAEVVLTNRGGVPLHYRLKGYHEAEGEPIDLIFDYDTFIKTTTAAEGDTVFKKPVTYPTLGLTFPRESFAQKINGAYYAVVSTEGDLTLASGPYTIVYAYRDEAGIEIRKSYTFTPG
ncbi:MAG: hypothetical protein HQK87_04365, partial [Nitrospinae bacterium]|nr:hypothetical protein [Nitrospinota bacterium]